MPPELSEWNDGRLNDLQRTVNRMLPTFEGVAVLTAAVSRLTVATEALERRVDDMGDEPRRRKQMMWMQIKVTLVGAIAGGGMTIVFAFLTGAFR